MPSVPTAQVAAASVPNLAAAAAAVAAANAQAQAKVQAQAQAAQAGALSQAQASAVQAVPSASSQEKAGEAEEEAPRCHLHRKPNKACKFCKAFLLHQEEKNKRIEESKSAALQKLKDTAASSAKALGQNDRAPLPGLAHFPSAMLDRIQRNDYFNSTVGSLGVPDLKGALAEAANCDVEERSGRSLDLEPSAFIAIVYRLLTLQLTEGQLQGFMSNRSPWIRCAGYVYVRLGFHYDRYWECLADALMDDEEFVPFPGRGGDTMTVGNYVEQLLTKDKYCEMALPRIPVAQKRAINRRMVLYGQFRRRYQANLKVLDRYEAPGVAVDVCSSDGEWTQGETVGGSEPSSSGRAKTVLVRFKDGERPVSIGMLIAPDEGGDGKPSSNDLTRSRGRSAQELLEKYEEQQRDNAVASGKDYCKTSGQHTLRVGGVPFVAGVKRKEATKEEEDEVDERFQKRGPSTEHQAKMAAIESKYCARVATGKSGGSKGEFDGPERMRLG